MTSPTGRGRARFTAPSLLVIAAAVLLGLGTALLTLAGESVMAQAILAGASVTGGMLGLLHQLGSSKTDTEGDE